MPDRVLADALIEVIRERMVEQGMSMNRLAGAIGMNQPTVQRHFEGSGNIPLDEFDAMAGALGEELEQLLIAARRRV